MKKRMIGTVLAICLCTIGVLSVGAGDKTETFTTSDGVLSLELPDDSWQEIKDPETWVSLSNGSELITLLHYRNGDELPRPTVADDTYDNVCQTYLSNRNEVFIITGFAADEEHFEDVRDAMESVKINIKDTKQAVAGSGSGSSAGSSTENSVGSTKTLYYQNGNTVTITRYSDGSWKDDGGIVYTVDSDDGSVWTNSEGSRLTIYDPWEAGELPPASRTNTITLINEENGDSVIIYEDENGEWKDSQDNTYFLREDGLWMDPYGGEWGEQ